MFKKNKTGKFIDQYHYTRCTDHISLEISIKSKDAYYL